MRREINANQMYTIFVYIIMLYVMLRMEFSCQSLQIGSNMYCGTILHTRRRQDFGLNALVSADTRQAPEARFRLPRLSEFQPLHSQAFGVPSVQLGTAISS